MTKPKLKEQLKCTECGEWSDQEDYKETEVGCEDCGSHPALECPKCEEVMDTIYKDLEERVTER